jgi:plasmid stabilization system protein ParE
MADFTLKLRSKALADLHEIRLWYHDIDPSVEMRFLSALNGCLDRILAFPFSYQIVYRNSRRALLDKFPYGVFYLIQDDRIAVLAILHLKRNLALMRKIAE